MITKKIEPRSWSIQKTTFVDRRRIHIVGGEGAEDAYAVSSKMLTETGSNKEGLR